MQEGRLPSTEHHYNRTRFHARDWHLDAHRVAGVWVQVLASAAPVRRGRAEARRVERHLKRHLVRQPACVARVRALAKRGGKGSARHARAVSGRTRRRTRRAEHGGETSRERRRRQRATQRAAPRRQRRRGPCSHPPATGGWACCRPWGARRTRPPVPGWTRQGCPTCRHRARAGCQSACRPTAAARSNPPFTRRSSSAVLKRRVKFQVFFFPDDPIFGEGVA
jgi:hypothetical protein